LWQSTSSYRFRNLPSLRKPCLRWWTRMPGCITLMERTRVRKIRTNGTIRLDDVSYYVKQVLAGQYVDVCIDAVTRELVVWHQHQPFKLLAIKGLQHTLLPFEQFMAVMAELLTVVYNWLMILFGEASKRVM
jgi:hypothetical protein